VRAVEPPIGRERTEKGPMATFRDIGAGIKAMVGDPILRALAGASAIFNFSTGILLTIFVLYAVRDRGMSAAEIGIVNACFGVGGVLGATLLGRVLARLGYGRLLVIGYIVAVLSIVAIPFVGGSGVRATVLFGLAYFVAGLTIISLNIAEVTLRQLIVPPAIMGRSAVRAHRRPAGRADRVAAHIVRRRRADSVGVAVVHRFAGARSADRRAGRPGVI
jgi:Na+/melibiose symporter-like transporter